MEDKPPINFVLLIKQALLWSFIGVFVIYGSYWLAREHMGWSVPISLFVMFLMILASYKVFSEDPHDSEFLTRSPRSRNSNWPGEG